MYSPKVSPAILLTFPQSQHLPKYAYCSPHKYVCTQQPIHFQIIEKIGHRCKQWTKGGGNNGEGVEMKITKYGEKLKTGQIGKRLKQAKEFKSSKTGKTMQKGR